MDRRYSECGSLLCLINYSASHLRTCWSIALDPLQIRPEASGHRLESWPRQRASTWSSTDGLVTPIIIPYTAGRGSVQRVLREARPPPPPSRYHMRRRRVVHRHAASYAGRMRATGSEETRQRSIDLPPALRCGVPKAPSGEKVQPCPCDGAAPSYQPRHACLQIIVKSWGRCVVNWWLVRAPSFPCWLFEAFSS